MRIHRRLAALGGAAAAAMLVTVALPAHAAPEPQSAVVAGPTSFAEGYYTSTVVLVAGSQLTFANTDIASHSVVAFDPTTGGAYYGPSGPPPCASATPPEPLSQCPPLFWSNTIGIGSTTAVNGTDTLTPGTYYFYCQIHPFTMRGTLTVEAQPGS